MTMYDVIDSGDLARSVVADLEKEKAARARPTLQAARLTPLHVERDHNGLLVTVDGLSVERDTRGLIIGLK